nr:hypothetical protein BaRGS_019011 [Batillaria attramentaria]
MAAPMRVEEGAPWPNHRFHGLAFKNGYCRQVAVTLSGCHKVVTRALPAPDSLVLNLYRYSGRYRTDKMYVVTEVIYAEELHVTVRVSINKDDVKILHRVPIAFRLHVYDVRRAKEKKGGMGDVTKRTSDITRRAGLELFPNRHRRGQEQVDFGGDRPERQAAN